MLHPTLDSSLRWLHGIAGQSAYKDVFWSLSLIACAFIALQINSRRVRSKASMSVEQKRQAKATFRNAMIFAVLGGLGFVWGGEIRSLILSLAAIAAAIMIVSKELITCVYGGFIFTFSQLAKIGDAIEVGSLRGELLDHNWLSFTLLEHSDTHFYSGKLIKVPNSVLLVTPLANLSQGGAYRFCTVLFHARQENATAALDCAKAAAEEVCSPWIESARASLAALQVQHLTQVPDATPLATLSSVDKDSLSISVRFVAPAGARATTQAEISRRYFESLEGRLRKEREAERVKAAASPTPIATHSPSPAPTLPAFQGQP